MPLCPSPLHAAARDGHGQLTRKSPTPRVAGMASMQWMLPFRGHSLVVLTNENESPARYALALTVLASTQSLLVELAKSLNGGATPFDTPSAVFFTELLKLLIALALWLRERPSLEYDGLSGWQFTPFLLFAIPALLFIVQNNAVFLAMELLDPHALCGSDKAFGSTWSKMDVSHVAGFPVWEREVFELLLKANAELTSIFNHYAKAGSAGSGSATAHPAFDG